MTTANTVVFVTGKAIEVEHFSLIAAANIPYTQQRWMLVTSYVRYIVCIKGIELKLGFDAAAESTFDGLKETRSQLVILSI